MTTPHPLVTPEANRAARAALRAHDLVDPIMIDAVVADVLSAAAPILVAAACRRFHAEHWPVNEPLDDEQDEAYADGLSAMLRRLRRYAGTLGGAR